MEGFKQMTNIIDTIDQQQMKQDIPEFAAGDTVIVKVKIKEGTRERAQAFEGVVIAKRNRGLKSSFTVRKISHGEGVERVFLAHSPQIESIEVKRRGDVRRAKLYYLRELTGRAARIKEKLPSRIKAKASADAKKTKKATPPAKPAANEAADSSD